MKFEVVLTEKAQQDIDFIEKSGNIPALQKILALLQELENHPKTGT